MTDSRVQIGISQDYLETEKFTNTNGDEVHREAVYIGSKDSFNETAAIANGHPDDADYALVTRPMFSRGAFGHQLVDAEVPIAQIVSTRGVTDKIEVFPVVGGTATVTDKLFTVTTGTDAAGGGAISSRRQAKYRAGQGTAAKFTAVFDTPATDTLQFSGLANPTDQLGFGYRDNDFGIIYNHDGAAEIQELTVTNGAGGSENATVTIDGTGYTVPLTSGSIQHTAYEIAASMAAQLPLWQVGSNGSVVTFVSLDAVAFSGAFTFSSATAAASFSQVAAGAIPTGETINQADWNVRKMPNLDPSKGNVYMVQMQFLGFGGIFFSVENPDTSEFELVHVIRYANSSVLPSVSSPTFRMVWLVRNLGNTTNLTVKGASGGLFNEGVVVIDEQSRALDNTQTSVTSSAFQNILTIRNRVSFHDLANQIEVKPFTVNGFTSGNKGAIIEVRMGATPSGSLTFAYVDEEASTMEYATNAVDMTGGKLIASFVATTAGSSVDLEMLGDLIFPGQSITISARVISGSSSDVTATIGWVEDQ